ncbi:hypothetical protein FPQ18DRAFT_313995 [Pyronema domesticum]|nr:hypothetical protein FPQ18DRAFT_313995 [Pyronema domesticum]
MIKGDLTRVDRIGSMGSASVGVSKVVCVFFTSLPSYFEIFSLCFFYCCINIPDVLLVFFYLFFVFLLYFLCRTAYQEYQRGKYLGGKIPRR